MLASVPEAPSSVASTAQTRHSGCIRYCSVAMTTHHNQGHSDKEEFISAYGFRRKSPSHPGEEPWKQVAGRHRGGSRKLTELIGNSSRVLFCFFLKAHPS